MPETTQSPEALKSLAQYRVDKEEKWVELLQRSPVIERGEILKAEKIIWIDAYPQQPTSANNPRQIKPTLNIEENKQLENVITGESMALILAINEIKIDEQLKYKQHKRYEK